MQHFINTLTHFDTLIQTLSAEIVHRNSILENKYLQLLKKGVWLDQYKHILQRIERLMYSKVFMYWKKLFKIVECRTIITISNIL